MLEMSYVESVVNVVEKTLFKSPFRKYKNQKCYRIAKVNKNVSLYNYLKRYFEEGIIKDFLYLSEEGIEKLKSLFHHSNLDECIKVEDLNEANLNIMNALSDYFKWFSKNNESLTEECLKSPNSEFNKELAKHVKYLLEIKSEKVNNLVFDDFDGLKKFIQIVYFLSQNLSDETVSDLTFYYSLINSDMRNIIELDADKIRRIHTITAFVPDEDSCEKFEEELSDYIDFTVFEGVINIEELLEYPEVENLVTEYCSLFQTKPTKLTFEKLNLIVNFFVDDKERFAKVRKVYYNLIKRFFVGKTL